MFSGLSKYLIAFAAGALIVIGIGIYIQALRSKIDKQSQEIGQLNARDHPDTIYVKGKVITAPPETTMVKRYAAQIVTRNDTTIVTSQDTVYVTINPSGTIVGNTEHRQGDITAHVGCKAYYPSGRMDFTIGLYSKPPRQGWIAGAMIGGGIRSGNKTVFAIGGDLTYRKYGIWAMGFNTGIMGGIKINF